MHNLVNPDGPVMQFIIKVERSVLLNILWFICCLPIVTIGASTTALFYCCQKIVLDEDSYIIKMFFHSFKENFRQSTVVGLIMTVVGIFFGLDGYILYHLKGTSVLWTLMTAVLIVALGAYAIVAMYIFPLMARFQNDIFSMFKNSLMIGMRFLMCTAFMAGVYFLMALIVVRFFTPAIIFGMGTCALFNSMLMKNILIQLEIGMEKAEEGTADDEKVL